MKAATLKVLLFTLLGIITFCLVAIAFQFYTLSVLPGSFIGACFGAIVSAIITKVLLNGQSEQEETKERNVKVFEKKSRLFHEYIDDLWSILSSQKLTMEDYDKLRKDFSIRLMLYLNEKDIRAIAAHLKNIGDCIDHSGNKYEFLKEQIVGIINILSGTLNLGGKIDIAIHRELEAPIFAMQFKQAIHNELNSVFSKDSDLQREFREGKFCKEDELISDGEFGGLYFCFDFRRFKGCKLLIGSFSKYCPHAGIWTVLFIEKDIHSVDKFRYNDVEEYKFCEFSKYLIPILDKDRQWAELTTSHPDNKEYASLGEFEALPEDTWLFLDDPEAIKPYRQNYQEVAHIIAERAKYWFNKGEIQEKNTLVSTVDFLQKYIKK